MILCDDFMECFDSNCSRGKVAIKKSDHVFPIRAAHPPLVGSPERLKIGLLLIGPMDDLLPALHALRALFLTENSHNLEIQEEDEVQGILNSFQSLETLYPDFEEISIISGIKTKLLDLVCSTVGSLYLL